jgi:hypothetical protein
LRSDYAQSRCTAGLATAWEAGEFVLDKLCVGTTCVTEEQFKAVFGNGTESAGTPVADEGAPASPTAEALHMDTPEGSTEAASTSTPPAVSEPPAPTTPAELGADDPPTSPATEPAAVGQQAEAPDVEQPAVVDSEHAADVAATGTD